MGVDAKSIQVCLFRIIKFSFNICSKFAIKHPLISTAFVLLLVFYFFLPRAFFLLIYSSPLVSCTYVFIRFYWYSQSKKIRKAAKKSDVPPRKVIRKDGKSVRRTYTRSSSRRNMEVKTRDFDSKIVDDDPVIGRALRSAAEKLDSSIAAAGDKIGELKSNRRVKSDCSSKVETEISTSEDEEAKESRNKAVEWNEDDQKNLMDLGLSELERNKRLESLIARRRARKLYKAQTDKNLMSSFNNSNHFLVSPVSIARCNTFDVSYSPDLGIPGSAPSILLQRNPFDLPYDPFEEKPNLMADSFQQEFMAAQQKEMVFCRHESFTVGSYYPFPTPHNEHNIAGQSGFKRHLDEGSSSLKVESSNQRNSQREEIQGGSSRIENTEMRTTANKQCKCESSSSSFMENDEQAARAKKATNLTHLTTSPFRFNENPTPSSGPCPLPKGRTVNELSYLASPATIDRSTLENHLLYTNSGPWHTPNDSIASDMQVEVSEIGSPPLTGDGSASSNDGDSFTYDGDVEKEITSGSDEHDRTSREENDEFSEENISRGLLGHHKEPEGSVIQLPQQHQTDPDLLDLSISYTSPQEEKLQNRQESMNFSEKSADEVNINYNLDVLVSSYDDLEDEKSVDVKCALPETSTNSEINHTVSKPAGEIISESSTHNESKPLSSKQSLEEVSIAYSTDVPAPTYDDLEDLKSVEATNPETAQDLSVVANDINIGCSNPSEIKSPNSQDQAIEEVRVTDTNNAPVDVSGTSQNLNDPSISGIQQGSMVEQVSSDPKSATQSMVELPQTSLDLNPHMRTGVSESNMEENRVRDKLLDEKLPENPAQNEQHEIVASADHPSTECNSPEWSDTLGKTIDEAVHDDEKTNEDLKAKEPIFDEPIGNEAAFELSNQPDEIEFRSAEHIESASGNLSEYDSSIQQTKPEEDSECKKFTKHTNAASSTKHMPSTVEEEAPHNSTTINDTVTDKISSKDQFKLISETESQGIYESSDTMEMQKSMEDLESIKGTKPESRNLTEDAARIDKFGGNNSSNNIKNVEGPEILQGNGSLKDDEHIKNEPKDMTENGNAVGKVTITDEAKALISEAP